MMRALLVAGCGVLTVTVSACESTEQESARLGREAAKSSAPSVVPKLGAVNHSIAVADVTFLNGEGRGAVAARLSSHSNRAQLDVPIEVEVKGPDGKVLYTNQTAGVEASVQRVPVLPAHGSVWWVDDQVSSVTGKPAISVEVGTGRKARHAPRLTVGGLKAGEQSGVSVVSGELRARASHGGGAAVYVVALDGRRVVAAGRAAVTAGTKFQAFLVGKPSGAKLEANAG
jgi:hypothetical protein